MRDLNDLIEGLGELKEKNKYFKCVADSNKKLPPIGTEFLASILVNLIKEINSVLPGILDLKSTVINTAYNQLII